EKTSSPAAESTMSPMTIGAVWRQAIAEFDGSWNQFPFESRSMRLRSKEVKWQVTPCTLGSATASTMIEFPVQSLRKLPTSSLSPAPARDGGSSTETIRTSMAKAWERRINVLSGCAKVASIVAQPASGAKGATQLARDRRRQNRSDRGI